MYIVTGGAGFIGSNLVAALSARGDEVVVSDWMGTDNRWLNIAKHEIFALLDPHNLVSWLNAHSSQVTAVLHIGAISATTETDVDLIVAKNIRATLDLLEWCTGSGTPFIYASSAATYGNGSAGFDDGLDREALAKLRPLNAYGWSKHVVDRKIARLAHGNSALPPQFVGLKFFNVYGPNEYHKGAMQSVIAQNFLRVLTGQPLRLFRSQNPNYNDGGQLRDFVYVKDCVSVILWLLDHRDVSGLFNLGTGKARSWLDLVNAMSEAIGRKIPVEFVDMPQALVEKYQYFTEARMNRLRAAGYEAPFTSLENGVCDYVRNFLSAPDIYG